MTTRCTSSLCPGCKSLAAAAGSVPLTSSSDALPFLTEFRDKKQEYFVCLSLDAGHRLIARRVVTIGLIDQALAHPREVFSEPLVDRAVWIIIAHNHPSGDPAPSKSDINTTQQLIAAGQILGIALYDHIIVAANEHYSFKANGLISLFPT